ncbi:MAG TPA: GTP diphosphokinase, partial [Methylococcaceae bacterium]|nr:GTP diphosphokinase [Methylococcaceae bacterium]
MKKQLPPIEQLLSEFAAEDAAQIEKALAIVDEADSNSLNIRPKGIAVAIILGSVYSDLASILAAILSDSRLAGRLTADEIKQQFGETVADLVKDVNWLNNLRVYSPELTHEPNQNETLRRM